MSSPPSDVAPDPDPTSSSSSASGALHPPRPISLRHQRLVIRHLLSPSSSPRPPPSSPFLPSSPSSTSPSSSSTFDPFGDPSDSDSGCSDSLLFRCVIDARWFKQWKVYVGYSNSTETEAEADADPDPDSEEVLAKKKEEAEILSILSGGPVIVEEEEEEEEEGETEPEPDGSGQPGPIPNHYLLLDDTDTNTDTDTDTDTSSRRTRPKLIPSLCEHKDFVAIPVRAYDFLSSWFGGGPKIIRRCVGDWRAVVVREGVSAPVEFFPYFFTIDFGASEVEVMIGADVVFGEFVGRIRGLAGSSGSGSRSLDDFWIVCSVGGRSYRSFRSDDVDLWPRRISEMFFRRTGQKIRIVREESQVQLWTVPPILVQGGMKEEEDKDPVPEIESDSESKGDVSAAVEEEDEFGFLTKEQKMVYSRFKFEDSDLWGGDPMVIPGATGLKNLGNTCYMNAALQALSCTKPVREFFVGVGGRKRGSEDDDPDEEDPEQQQPSYSQHIVAAKSSGRLSHAFARLLRMLWCGKFGWVSPRECRFLVQRLLHSRFSGSDENDASELLQGLIYQLHCDLKQPCDSDLMGSEPMSPVTSEFSEDVRSNPDKQWREFLKAENSFIFRLLLKQDRSVQGCKCQSTTYYETDIQMRLQMPVLRTLTVKFYDANKVQPALLDFEIDDETISIAELLRRREGEKQDDSSEESEQPEYVIAKEKGGQIIGFVPHDAIVKTLLYERFDYNLLAYESVCSEGEEFLLVRVCRTRIFDETRVSCADPLLVPFNVETEPPSALFTKIRLLLSRYERAENKFDDETDEESSLFRTPPDGVQRVRNFGVIFRLFFDDAEEASLNSDEIFYTSEGKIDFAHREGERKICVLMTEYKFRHHYAPTWMRSFGKGTVRALRQFTLNELIQNYTKPEIYKYFCDECHRSKRKKLDLWRLPEILVISFKRFDAFQRKIRTFVRFPLANLSLDGLSPSPHLQGHVYDLTCVINHTGEMFGGHYTVHAKFASEDGEMWIRLDDERTRVASVDEIVSDKAYVLFYQRRKEDSAE